jgi:hypothetical protein
METNRDHSSTPVQYIREDEIEILIARYTLEYLYHWTNQFDAAGLMEFKNLFDRAGTPEALANVLKFIRNQKLN